MPTNNCPVDLQEFVKKLSSNKQGHKRPFLYFNTSFSKLGEMFRDGNIMLGPDKEGQKNCVDNGPRLTDSLFIAERKTEATTTNKGYYNRKEKLEDVPVILALDSSIPSLRQDSFMLKDVSRKELIHYPELIDLVKTIDTNSAEVVNTKGNVFLENSLYSSLFEQPNVLLDLEEYWLHNDGSELENIPSSLEEMSEERKRIVSEETEKAVGFYRGLLKRKKREEQRCLVESDRPYRCKYHYEDRELGSFSLEWLSEKGKIPSYIVLPIAEILKDTERAVFYKEPLKIRVEDVQHICVPEGTDREVLSLIAVANRFPEGLRKTIEEHIYDDFVLPFEQCKFVERTEKEFSK